MSEERKPPLDGLGYGIVNFRNDYMNPIILTDNIEDANVIISRTLPGPWVDPDIPVRYLKHKVIVDIDMPVKVIESSTPGHSHLYIDVDVTWKQFMKLLDALVDAGIVQAGYRDASSARGFTALRLPWIKKELMDQEEL